MSNKFTYIIRSSSKVNTEENTNNCEMRLTGLPSQYKYYDCKVVGFYIETVGVVFTSAAYELRVDGIDFVNGLDSKGGRLKTLALTSSNHIFSYEFSFRCSNFNRRTLRFQLFDSSDNLLTNNDTNYNLPWKLALNIEGVLD